MNNLPMPNNMQSMSSKDLADITNKRHDSVKRTIETLAEKGVIRLPQYVITEEINNLGLNQKTKSYIFTQSNKRDSYVVVAQLSPEFTARLVDRWQELENKDQPVIPSNYSEALKLAYEQSLVIEDQSRRLVEKDNLILAGNEASIKAGEILVREFVKSVDIVDLGEKQFYEWMRKQGYVLKNSCEPDGALVKRGYFTWKPTDIEHGGKCRYTLRITPRGKVWLSARYLAWLDNEADAA